MEDIRVEAGDGMTAEQRESLKAAALELGKGVREEYKTLLAEMDSVPAATHVALNLMYLHRLDLQNVELTAIRKCLEVIQEAMVQANSFLE